MLESSGLEHVGLKVLKLPVGLKLWIYFCRRSFVVIV